MVISNFK
jgi:hypothetical protein